MSDKIDAEWLFGVLENRDDLVAFPIIELVMGKSVAVITEAGVLFLKSGTSGFSIGAKKSETGFKTLLGFQVEPTMKSFDVTRGQALFDRLLAALNQSELEFFNKKAIQEIQRIEVWRSLGSAMTVPIKEAAAWLDDLFNEHADKLSEETSSRLGRIRHIMDDILEEGTKRRRRVLL